MSWPEPQPHTAQGVQTEQQWDLLNGSTSSKFQTDNGNRLPNSVVEATSFGHNPIIVTLRKEGLEDQSKARTKQIKIKTANWRPFIEKVTQFKIANLTQNDGWMTIKQGTVRLWPRFGGGAQNKV